MKRKRRYCLGKRSSEACHFIAVQVSDAATRSDIYFFITQMLSSKDVNFMGYTYKNFEIVNDHEVPGMGKCHIICFHMLVYFW